MTTHGYLFALGRDQAKQLFGQRDEPSVRAFVRELQQQGAGLDCGTQWNRLQRCLDEQAASSDLAAPLALTFLGGRPMVEGEHLVRLVRPDLTAHVAAALAELSPEELRLRLARLVPQAGDSLEAASSVAGRGDRLQDSTPQLVDLLAQVRDFYDQAAGERQAVVFATLAE